MRRRRETLKALRASNKDANLRKYELSFCNIEKVKVTDRKTQERQTKCCLLPILPVLISMKYLQW